MRSIITLLIVMALGLAALISANPGDNGPHDAEIYKYHGKALAEVWIGRGAVNGGDVHGEDLYYKMASVIHDFCKLERSTGEMHACVWSGWWEKIPTHQVKGNGGNFPWPTQFEDANIEVWIEAKWTNKIVYEYLIQAVSRSLQELTSTTNNCYTAPNRPGNKLCNIPDFIRINMPHLNGHDNFMHLHLRGGKVYSSFKCCKTRDKVDAALDQTGNVAADMWGASWSREVRCLVKGMDTCEDCGKRCDGCTRSPCSG